MERLGLYSVETNRKYVSLTLEENTKLFSKVGVPIYTPMCMRVPTFLHPNQFLVSQIFIFSSVELLL